MLSPPPDTTATSDGAESLEGILQEDPSGDYAAMEAATRGRYRQACLELAAWSKRAPAAVAREAIQLSREQETSDARGRHVGAQLLAEGRPRLEARLGCQVPWPKRIARGVQRHVVGAYIGSILILTLLVLGGVGRLLAWEEPLHRALFLSLLALPILRFVHETFDSVLLSFMGTLEPLPRLDPERVLSQDTRTLVVTPLLIASAEDIDSQLRQLEINYQGNVSPHVLFALLTDFSDAPAKEMPGDRELLDRVERGIGELNARHGHREHPRFFFLHRERRWNPVAGRWMGWERKRGKLEEFNRLVLGASDTSYTSAVPGIVRTIRYVITLDADNHLLPGSAALLVATLHHPLNRPRFDATGRRVIAGYSMIQPSIEDSPTREKWLASGGRPLSIIRRRESTQGGLVSTGLSQTLFGVGEFLGKGLYDVAAFTRSLEGRIPDNIVLSHDKLEGMYARVALAGDIVLMEGRPTGLVTTARIFHRWIRGDWQLLPWIFPWVPSQGGRLVPTSLSLLDRWKLLTDLLRSLNPPVMLLVLVYGWLRFSGSDAGVWTLIAALWLGSWMLVSALVSAISSALGQDSLAVGLRTVATSLPRALGGTLMILGLLVPSSALVLDAIGRALYRLAIDRRRILDWTTHAQSSRKARAISVLMLPEIWAAAALTLVIIGAIAAFNPGALPWALPMLIAWMPLLAIHRGRMFPAVAAMGVSQETEQLRVLARRSWAFYEELDAAGREPPRSSLSEQGSRGGATEVLPTDLALWLVAPLSAYHLGYMTLEGWVSRLGESLTVLEGLERQHGHFFERYDACSLRPLSQRVSKAESSMLAAALIVVESALRAARASPTSPQVLCQGLIDTLAVLREELQLRLSPSPGKQPPDVLTTLRAKVAEGTASLEEVIAEVRRQQAVLPAVASAATLPAWWRRLEQQLALLERASLPVPDSDAERLLARLGEVEARARSLREKMDFVVLGNDEDPRRTAGELLAGFLAISRREVPLSHWLDLVIPAPPPGSAVRSVAGRDTLAAHLLPSLFLWFPPATLLGQGALAMVDADIALGAARGIPWGVKEVLPGTEGAAPAPPVTIHPYLSVLALRFRPRQAFENLHRLMELGARGGYGLFDSLQTNQPHGEVEVRRTFTCRSQGITLAAVANLACDDILVQHFHQHWQTGWVENLVYETAAAP